MNLLLIALFLQLVSIPPVRDSLTNPAAATPVPKQLQKDYDKLWARFLKGKEDAKVLIDIDKQLLKKDKDLVPALMIQFYIHFYAGRRAEAERKLEAVLALRPTDRFALSSLAEAAYSRNEFDRVAELYGRLLALDPSQRDLEMRRQKAVLQAIENVLRAATQAAQEGRLADAEALYRRALQVAPQEAVLHGQLASLLLRQKKWDEAIAEFRRQIELGASADEAQRGIAEALTSLGRTDEARATLEKLRGSGARDGGIDEGLDRKLAELDGLGRWGNDVGRFREIGAAPSITREQLAWITARYFPQILELKQNPQIVTDVQDSWAGSEIHTVVAVGLLDPLPNHTFLPSRTVSRGEFAQAIARLIRLLGVSLKEVPPATAPDLVPGSSLYRELQLVLGHGLMALDDAGNFNVAAPVSGGEAVKAAEKLLRLIREKAA